MRKRARRFRPPAPRSPILPRNSPTAAATPTGSRSPHRRPASSSQLPTPTARETKDGRLPTWSGNLLDEQNRGAFVEPGTLVCLVGDPKNLSAVLLVDDTDVARLVAGPKGATHSRTSAGRSPHRRSPRRRPPRCGEHRLDDERPRRPGVALRGPHAAGPRRHALPGPRQARPPAHALAIGGRGEAKIAAERITFARWLARYFAQTFRLPT